MATRTLTTSYLVRLSVANHDGVTQQIDADAHSGRGGRASGSSG